VAAVATTVSFAGDLHFTVACRSEGEIVWLSATAASPAPTAQTRRAPLPAKTAGAVQKQRGTADRRL
jgi:hypothetical protein